MDKDKLAKRIDECHKGNNTLDTVIVPSQQASLSQALSSQTQRPLALFGVGRGRPTLGFFERAEAETGDPYLGLSIEAQ